MQKEVVMELFRMGMPCSRIDRELNLTSGMAKRCVIQCWAEDKAQASHEKITEHSNRNMNVGWSRS